MIRSLTRALWASALFLLLLLGTSCRDLPQAGWDRLKQVRQHLSDCETDRWFPGEATAFEDRYGELRERYIGLEAEWAWLRSGKELQTLSDEILGLEREAQLLIQRSIELRQEKMDSLRMEMAALEDLLDPDLHPTLIPELRLQRTTASLHLSRLRLHLAEGDPWAAEKALRELRESSQVLSSYFDRLEQRFSDPELLARWNRLSDRAVALSGSQRRGVLIVDKYHRKVLLLRNRKVVRSFEADLGWNGMDDKSRQGDGATPEGEYKITKLKGAGETRYHRALLLNYPNPEDRAEFARLVRTGKIPKGARIGNLIEIHGEGGRGTDWTDGCVALENGDMEILFGQAYAGMPVFVVGKCRIVQ